MCVCGRKMKLVWICHKDKPHRSPKISYTVMQFRFIYIQHRGTRSVLSGRNVPKAAGHIQVSFQSFIENKGHRCRGRVPDGCKLHFNPDWCWRENHDGRRRITGNHWQTQHRVCQQSRRPKHNPTLPTASQHSSNSSALFFYTSIKPLTAPLFLPPEVFFFIFPLANDFAI